MSGHRQRQPEVDHNQPGVLCFRCNHLNVVEATACKKCGAELYRNCPRCGHANPIVFANCRKCHKRFPRGILGNRLRRWRKAKSLARWAISTAGQVILVLVSLAVLAGLAYLIMDHLRSKGN